MATLGTTSKPAYVYDTETDTWVPIGVGAHTHDYIPNTLADAKGDLFTATSDNTPARLAVGNNGETLVADSSTSTGLRYQSAYNGNGVINGGMDIWQRGTSFALTSPAVAYTADRWLGRHFGTNVTYSQQASGLTGIQYSLRVQRPNGATGTNEQAVYYQFETADSYRFAGQTVTLSFWAKAGANFSQPSSVLTSQIISGTGTNQNITSGAYTGQVTVANQNNTLTTSWQRFSVTATVGSTATQIALLFITTPNGTAGANDWYEITGVQLELGSVATSFKRSAGGSIQGELAACHRYYYRQTTATNYGNLQGVGVEVSGTSGWLNHFAPTTMRVKPSSVDYSALKISNATTSFAITALSLNANNADGSFFMTDWTSASGGTANRPCILQANNNSAAYIGFSAEL